MESIGQMIRSLREEKGEPLRVLAAHLQIDQAIMSKIETGQRKPTKSQVEKLAKYFGADKKQMLIAWLSDRIVYEIEGEQLVHEALKAAEEKVAYRKTKAGGRKTTVNKIKRFLEKDGRIKKAWIFGSFARGDDRVSSDIDILIEEKDGIKFSYFDLADIQYKLELLLHKKIDIGFATALKKGAADHILTEAELIYDKS